MSTLDVAGTRTRLRTAGPQDSAEAVVFVHGNPGSADDFGRFVDAVGALGLRAVAFDLPDFGETVAPAGFEHTVGGYASFVDAVLETLAIERVHLVVHDFGGPIGLAWSAGRPDRLASVTLIDTGVLPGYRWHALARIWRTPVLGELFQYTATRPAFRMIVNRSEPRGLPREFLDGMYDHYDRRTRRAVLKLYRATGDPGAGGRELAALLAPRDLPALVIWGEHDAYLAAEYAERQRDVFPSADVHVLPASGHWPYADAPETVERLLVAHLQKAAALSPA
ncbi:alpha/beta hydrolase [Conexibacter stalactiti]|uniref:Alpha/beta hydrolase n=1 Tax=Conexibacter stalactiti TaxID=1940611 RepID=A0ABU4HLV6_9ACTN|nr:alpha/beta hydrolase [Conexibacter stalactiti]MDW5593707.1 alpha/beta hydrolase [Conexibacter stalactiti]MEC5034348.1 alpha/beta hydrolase [Conexibacter stalactiti]